MSENATWYKIITISDWYDGPRSGATEFRGTTYWYRSVYLDSAEWNHNEDRFELTQITVEVLNWEIELKDIFNRWESARKNGSIVWNTDESTFGAIPDEMLRYQELKAKLDAYLSRTKPELLVHGKFEPGYDRVHWELISLHSDDCDSKP